MGILDKIFRKKSDVQAGEQSKTTVSQPVPVDDKPLPIVNDLVMPKNLHCKPSVNPVLQGSFSNIGDIFKIL